MMYGREKSDAVVVAMKPTNKTGKPAAELAEPRTAPKRNANEQSTLRTQSRALRVTGARLAYGKHHFASPSSTPGRSRMREFRTSGSVRGAASNGRPYRERQWV